MVGGSLCDASAYDFILSKGPVTRKLKRSEPLQYSKTTNLMLAISSPGEWGLRNVT